MIKATKLTNKNNSVRTSFLQRGMTLIQVMATLGVLGIILAASTSGYLKHQNAFQINEAFEQAQIATKVVNQNYEAYQSQKTDAVRDFAVGYTEQYAKDSSWNVKIDSNSGAVIASVLVDAKTATFLLIPTKQKSAEPVGQVQLPSDTDKKESSLNANAGLFWICVIKNSEIPSQNLMLGALSPQAQTPDLVDELRPTNCR
jgi:type II secretory pathway pseudopilin PulG